MAMASPEPAVRWAIDRPLGWLISIGGCILILDQTLVRIPELARFQSWWNFGAMTVLVVVVLLAATGMFLPLPVLEAVWRVIPVAYVTLQATWLPGLAGGDPEATLPWLWTLEPAVLSLLILVLPPAVAIGAGLCFSLTPALSALLLTGHVPHLVLQTTPNQLANVVYAAVLLGLRSQLGRLHEREQRAAFQRSRQVRAAARLEQHTELQRIVHDEVLSVLTGAMLTSGAPSAELRLQAHRAIVALDASSTEPVAAVALAGTDAADLIATELRRIDDGFALSVRANPATVSPRVAKGLALAAGEALRNSLRHAGSAATRQVSIRTDDHRLEVRVRDDGTGFDPSSPTDGLGVATSIVGRMGELGGAAHIHTAPGEGVEVVLTWPN